jgi:hypothetical protein
MKKKLSKIKHRVIITLPLITLQNFHPHGPPTTPHETALPPPIAGAKHMVQVVRNTLCIYDTLWGGKFACETAEELLLHAIAMIERTAGKQRARETLREISKAL